MVFEGSGKSGGAGVITKPLQGLVFLPLIETSIRGVPVEAGGVGTTSGSIGAYGEVGRGPVAGGVGGYANITTRAACQ